MTQPIAKASNTDTKNINIDSNSNQRDARARPIVTGLSWMGGIAGLASLGAVGTALFNFADDDPRFGVLALAGALVFGAASAGSFMGAAHIAQQN